jgi:uncharacterized protein (DUF1786 family)
LQILTVDIGTGTQDLYLFRAGLALENGFKLVMPSPTMRIRGQIQRATAAGEAVLLTGVMMGGGPCHWAAEAHREAGYPLFATPEAARTFNDDLDWVQNEMGVEILNQPEALRRDSVTRIEMRDFDYPAIHKAFEAFGFDLDPDAVCVAVFDHGAAPRGVSDRQFRFDYLEDRIASENSLAGFAFLAEDVPPSMTRMQAVVASAEEIACPVVLMDTAPAAVLGATLDPQVADRERKLVANVGNFHTLAFRLGPEGIEGLFEHHTGFLDRPKLEALLHSLAEGSITHEQVFDDHGHGALTLDGAPHDLDSGPFGVAVTGPRRSLLRGSRLRPYFAAPFGDMMITGCFGLLAACASVVPQVGAPIRDALAGAGSDTTPWDAE